MGRPINPRPINPTAGFNGVLLKLNSAVPEDCSRLKFVLEMERDQAGLGRCGKGRIPFWLAAAPAAAGAASGRDCAFSDGEGAGASAVLGRALAFDTTDASAGNFSSIRTRYW